MTPKDLGFKFNPKVSVFDMIKLMLDEFEASFHVPAQAGIAMIGVDAEAYFQLRAELKKKIWMPDRNHEPSGDIVVFGFPVFVLGVEGICFGLRDPMALSMLGAQMKMREIEKAEQQTELLRQIEKPFVPVPRGASVRKVKNDLH